MTVKPVTDIDNNIIKTLSQCSQNNYEDFLSQDSQMANKTCMEVQENRMIYFELSLF